MARRSQLHLHLKEVCALASPSPSPLDLSDPSLLAALHPRCHSLAVASPSSASSSILVLASSAPRLTRIAPSLRESHGALAALEWVPFPGCAPSYHDDADPPPPVLAVGTTAGYLLFYSLGGDLIHRQSVYPAKILSLNFRDCSSPSPALSLVFPGLIARFDASHLQSMLQKWSDSSSRLHQHNDDDDDDTSFSNVPFQLWNVNKFGSCADAAIVSLIPPPLLELQSTQRYYCAVTIGDDAVISAYRLSEDRSRSLVGAILSKVGTATISAITSFSSILWRREPTPTKKPRPKPQAFAKASALTCVKDPPRKGERLTLSPSGTLAAVTDSLGRILLLDTQALVVVRLWKGYRDAHCLFVEMLTKKDKSTTSNYYGYSKNDYCLCLAIHAPRKGIIEIWQMRTGPRLLTIQCPKGSKMLQPSIRFSSSDSSYNPLELYLLNGDTGQLFVLNRHIS